MCADVRSVIRSIEALDNVEFISYLREGPGGSLYAVNMIVSLGKGVHGKGSRQKASGARHQTCSRHFKQLESQSCQSVMLHDTLPGHDRIWGFSSGSNPPPPPKKGALKLYMSVRPSVCHSLAVVDGRFATILSLLPLGLYV